MGTESGIQWTNHTYNPWHGCIKVSEGCKFCYMYRDKERYGQDPTTVLRSKTNFRAPLKWKEPALVFTCSWSDFFIKEADEWRDEAWAIIKATPHLTYQILTKRIDRVRECLPKDWGNNGYPNVWLGVSVENQERADERIPALMGIPAVVRFLSCEPLLAPLNLRDYIYGYHESPLHWIIIGGESGHETGKYRYRECDAEWIMSIISQCAGSVPVFVKQLGTFLAKKMFLKDSHGGDINEWGDLSTYVNIDIRIREFPKQYKQPL